MKRHQTRRSRWRFRSIRAAESRCQPPARRHLRRPIPLAGVSLNLTRPWKRGSLERLASSPGVVEMQREGRGGLGTQSGTGGLGIKEVAISSGAGSTTPCIARELYPTETASLGERFARRHFCCEVHYYCSDGGVGMSETVPLYITESRGHCTVRVNNTTPACRPANHQNCAPSYHSSTHSLLLLQCAGKRSPAPSWDRGRVPDPTSDFLPHAIYPKIRLSILPSRDK